MSEILIQNQTPFLVTLKQNEPETQCNSLRGFTCCKYCKPSYERISEIRDKICWLQNVGPQWEYVTYLRVPAQACLLNLSFIYIQDN
jgi:hypothetical protein